ncbi:MAG TPA: extracellular solute-binding protein [Phycisphaerae bacterium]|nr:extracellular solute-binding protein [Phycisphaerae bacterium]
MTERGSSDVGSARTLPAVRRLVLIAAAAGVAVLLAWSLVAESGHWFGALAEGHNPNAPRRIIYWEKWTGFEGEAMQRVVDEFNRRQRLRAQRQSGYRPIEVEKVIVSEIGRKFMVAVAGGDPPDLAGLWSNNVASYAEKGAMMDLTETLPKLGITREQFIPVYWGLCEHRGRVWAVPTAPATTALHCNTRLFREVDPNWQDPPRTIEEMDRWAERLTKWRVTTTEGTTEIRRGYCPNVPDDRKRLIQVGFLPSEPGWWRWQWGCQFGGTLHDPNRGITADDPANVRAYEWIASHARKLGPKNIQRFQSGFGNFSSPQNAFLCGKVAMELQGVWMANFISKYAPGMRWKAAPFPYPADRPDLKDTTYCDSDVLAIPRGCPHPREAQEFLRFVCSQEGMEILCLGQRKFSPLAVESERFRREHPHPYIGLFRSLAMGPNVYAPPRISVWEEYTREMANAYNTIQNHPERSVREILGGVRVTMQRALERENRRYDRRIAAAE